MTVRSDPYLKAGFSGQVTAASGSVTGLPDVESTRVLLRALPGNTSPVYVGMTTGTMSPTNGLPLAKDDPAIVLEGLQNLNQLELVTVADGDGVSFLALHDPLKNPIA